MDQADKTHKKSGPEQGGEKEEDRASSRSHVHDDACRCKETSQMKPGELLKLMISDLAFWKKRK